KAEVPPASTASTSAAAPATTPDPATPDPAAVDPGAASASGASASATPTTPPGPPPGSPAAEAQEWSEAVQSTPPDTWAWEQLLHAYLFRNPAGVWTRDNVVSLRRGARNLPYDRWLMWLHETWDDADVRLRAEQFGMSSEEFLAMLYGDYTKREQGWLDYGRFRTR
ncbi:MAG: hypothetical protein KDD44_04840, partial [Bdellovibrionales bacterium]|nr:hypothetical protein [Bdellovibrionales bacterium]